jgi:hypothetical protein
MLKTEQVYKLNDEIAQAFRQEQMDEDEHRHKELIKAILQFTKKSKTYKFAKKNDKEETGFGLLDAILTGLKLWALELISKIKDFFGKFKIPNLGGGLGGGRPPKPGGRPPKPGGRPPKPNGTPGSKTPTPPKPKPNVKVIGRTPEGKIKLKPGSTATKAPKVEPPKSTVKKLTNAGSKALKAAGDAKNFLGSISKLNVGINVGLAAYQIGKAEVEYSLGQITEDELHKTITSELGSALGGIIGTELGAMLGLLGGPFAPLVAVAGSVGGGYVGSMAGREIAEKMYDAFIKEPGEIPFNEKLNLQTFGKTEGGAAMGGAHIKNNLSPKATPEVKNITIPMSYNKSLGLDKGESVVAVNTKVNNIAKPPKIVNTKPASARDEAIQRQLRGLISPF